MTAVGLAMLVGGIAILWAFVDEVPDAWLIPAFACAVLGFFLLTAGAVVWLWRVMP